MTEKTASPASMRPAAIESLSVTAAGAERLPRRWPGLIAIPVSYAIAAATPTSTRTLTSCRR